ncbi:MAG TPA: YdcF family protein [Terriglobia bacterium]|nr:YdcF family protein [Terriglobia bacterium]
MAAGTLKRLMKWGVALALAATLGLAGYGWYVYRQVRDTAERDEARAADAIVVMGAAQYNGRPSPVLKARLDHALALYQEGYADWILTTGGYGLDPDVSEAHVSTLYLIKAGVDESHILTQQGSDRTTETVRAAATLMRERNWMTALVVSDGFHLFRVKKVFEDEGVTAYTSPAPASLIETDPSQRFWFSLREVLLYGVYKLIHQ